jgi:cytochrome c oxidase cbb3-type subunit III
MKQIVSACLLASAAITVLSAQRPAAPGNALEAIAEGRTIYNKTCTGCHGPDGGQGDRAPALDASRRYFRLSETAIFETVKNGIAGTAMPAAGLPDDDVRKVVAFIRSIRGTASDTIVPGDAQKGMAVFTGAGGCVRCHMIRGQGGVLGPDLSSIGAQISVKKLEESLTQEGPIPKNYRPLTVTTSAGETVSGIARNSDAFSIQLLDERGKLRLFETSELTKVVYGQHSLMPHNFNKVLTPEQYHDLLAMLAQQARTKVKIRQQGENEVGR